MNEENRFGGACERFSPMLDAYMDGALSEEDLGAVKAHAAACPDCARKLRATEWMKNEMCHADEGICVPLSASAAWKRAVRAEIARKKRRVYARWASGLAAALVVMFATTFVMREAGVLSASTGSGLDMAAAPTYVSAPSAKTTLYAVSGRLSAQEMPAYAAKESRMLLQADGETEDVLPLAGNTAAPEDAQTPAAGESAQMVRSANRSAQTEWFDQEKETLGELVAEYDGYFAQDSVDSTGPLRVATCVLRVPDEQLDTFLAALDNVGKTLSLERVSEDMATYYFDAQSRLESQKLIAQRLNTLISEADGEALAALNAQLSEAYNQIDEMERLLRAYETDMRYATVSLTLTEVRSAPAPTQEPSLSQRSASGFSQSLSAIGDFFEDMVVSMAIIAPVAGAILLVAAAVCAVVYFVKKKNKPKDGSGEPEEE